MEPDSLRVLSIAAPSTSITGGTAAGVWLGVAFDDVVAPACDDIYAQYGLIFHVDSMGVPSPIGRNAVAATWLTPAQLTAWATRSPTIRLQNPFSTYGKFPGSGLGRIACGVLPLLDASAHPATTACSPTAHVAGGSPRATVARLWPSGNDVLVGTCSSNLRSRGPAAESRWMSVLVRRDRARGDQGVGTSITPGNRRPPTSRLQREWAETGLAAAGECVRRLRGSPARSYRRPRHTETAFRHDVSWVGAGPGDANPVSPRIERFEFPVLD
jgi:hypothetical protein